MIIWRGYPTPPGDDQSGGAPEMLSAIIMHLLEKEPDDRYQSADGVSPRPCSSCAQPGVSTAAALRVGGRDFPLRLLPPSRLIGRDDEVVALSAAFDDALTGGAAVCSSAGQPGWAKRR